MADEIAPQASGSEGDEAQAEEPTSPPQETPPEVDEKGVPWHNRFQQERRMRERAEARYDELNSMWAQHIQTQTQGPQPPQTPGLFGNQWGQPTATPQPAIRPQQTPFQAGPGNGTPDVSQMQQTGQNALQQTMANLVRQEVQQMLGQQNYQTEQQQSIARIEQRFGNKLMQDGIPTDFGRQVQHRIALESQKYATMGQTPPANLAEYVTNATALDMGVFPGNQDMSSYDETSRQAATDRASAPTQPSGRPTQPKQDETYGLPQQVLDNCRKTGQDPKKIAELIKRRPGLQDAVSRLKGGGR